MTLDGFLTFFTLVVAALSFMPALTRLWLRTALGWWALWSAMGLLAVLYFQFFHVVALPCPVWPEVVSRACEPLEMAIPGSGAPSDAVTPQQASFLVVLAWMLFAVVGIQRPRVRGSSLRSLARLVEQLAIDRRHQELVDYLEPNVEKIAAFATRRSPLQRLHDRLANSDAPVEEQQQRWLSGLIGEELPRVPLRKRLAGAVGRAAAKLVPAGRDKQEISEAVLHVLLTKRDVVTFIAEFRPVFGARLLRLGVYAVADFSDMFVQSLISKPTSRLYEEVERNQNVGPQGPALTDDARLLAATFGDPELTSTLELYRPLCEHVLGLFDPVNDPTYGRTLNLPWNAAHDEQGKWRDPTFVMIQVMNLTVHRAAFQGVPSHMWLMYLGHLTKSIVANYDDTCDGVDLTNEWPTRSANLLYVILSALCDWVTLAEMLPEDSPHRVSETERIEFESGIPKSAAVTLGWCLALIVNADNVGDEMKSYLLDITLRRARRLNLGRAPGWLRPMMLKAITTGGIIDEGVAYRYALRGMFDDLDHVLRSDLPDFAAMLPPRAPAPTARPPVHIVSPAAPRPRPTLWQRLGTAIAEAFRR